MGGRAATFVGLAVALEPPEHRAKTVALSFSS